MSIKIEPFMFCFLQDKTSGSDKTMAADKYKLSFILLEALEVLICKSTSTQTMCWLIAWLVVEKEILLGMGGIGKCK